MRARGAGARMRRLGVVALVAVVAATGCGPAEPSPTPTADARATESPTAAPATTSEPSPTPTPTPSPTVDPLPEGPVTALLLGTDAQEPGSWGGRPDTIVVAQLSADRQTLALISVTRDSWVSIPGVGEAKINAAFPAGGTELMRTTVSELFGGLEIDYVVQANYEGFVSLIEAVDGFWVENRNPSVARFVDGAIDGGASRYYDFTADPLLLDDGDGIYFVRQRIDLPYGDLDRAERARASIIGLLERLDELAADPPALTAALVHIASAVRITGDLQIDDMVALAALSQELERDDILSLMAPLAGFTGRAGASVNIVDEPRTAALGEALRAGDVRAYVAAHGDDYAP